jgi:hypothetical protein
VRSMIFVDEVDVEKLRPHLRQTVVLMFHETAILAFHSLFICSRVESLKPALIVKRTQMTS